MKNKICIADIIQVALDLKKEITKKEALRILKNYPTAQEELGSSCDWDSVIEDLIYELLDDKVKETKEYLNKLEEKIMTNCERHISYTNQEVEIKAALRNYLRERSLRKTKENKLNFIKELLAVDHKELENVFYVIMKN